MRFKKIYIEIINKCNLNCSFCVPHKRANKDMPLEEFNLILEKIKPYTEYIYLHVKGEPLLHPKFHDFCKLAYEKGFKVNVTTNGTLLNDNLDVTKYIRQLNISLHATNNKEIVKIAKTIKNCYVNFRVWSIDKGSTTISILENEFDVDLKTKLSQKLGEVNHDNLTKEINFTIKDNFYISVQNEWEWPDINSNDESNGYCHALKDHIAVLVDGSVIPCCLDNNGIISLGNIFEDDLDSILNSQRVQNMIEGFKNRICTEELCKKCTYKLKF